MSRAPDSSALPVGSLAVGSLAWMPFGGGKVLVTVTEDRGALGVGGSRIVAVRFMLDSTEEPFDTEVAADRLELVAGPHDPPERRTSVEGVGRGWVGIYVDLVGRVAVVTEEMSSKELAKQAAVRWVREGAAEGSNIGYSWHPDPRYPGRYSVYREGRLGPQLVRTSAA